MSDDIDLSGPLPRGIEGKGLFADARRAAKARGIRPGPYGVCPACDTGIEELVRIGENLVCDPCAHILCRLPYLKGMYPLGPRKPTPTQAGKPDGRTTRRQH